MGRNDTSRENIRYLCNSFQDNTEEHKLIGKEVKNQKGFCEILCGLVQLQVTMEEQNGSSKSLGCGISSSDSSDFLY